MKKFKVFFNLIWVLLAVASCTEVPEENSSQFKQSNLIEIFFNQPGANRHSTVDPDIDDRLIHLFDSAKESIYFSFYGFSHEEIADSIVRAVERGLDVQFSGDYSHYSRREAGYRKFEEAVKYYPNARMSIGNSQSIMHNKWAVVDRQLVFTGTGNISYSGMQRNDNIWFIIRSKELGQDFINEHQQMMQGRFGVAKREVDKITGFCIGGSFNREGSQRKERCIKNGTDDTPGIFLENFFAPQEDAIGAFTNAVVRSKEEVDYMIFAFTHDKVGRTLTSQHRSFVNKNKNDSGRRRVRGVLDRSQFSHAQYIEVYRLASFCPEALSHDNNRCENPMDLRRDGNENTNVPGDWQGGGGRLHSKAMVIDPLGEEPKSLVGSFNWSTNASTNNDENLVIIHDAGIARKMQAKFEELYATAPELPGETAQYQEVVISEVNWAGSTRSICFDESGSRIAYTPDCTRKRYYQYDGNEFVELYNPNDRAIDISYWSLFFPVQSAHSDDSIHKRAFMGFPEGTKIPPKGFFVVWEPDQRNDIQDAYAFGKAADLLVYSPYNGLSNFMSLYDRRNRATSFANCRHAFSSVVTGFPGSNEWRIPDSQDGAFGFEIQLKDNRGNLIDIVKAAGLGNRARIERGGFSTTLPEPHASSWPPPSSYTCPDPLAAPPAAVYYTFSMERLPSEDDGSWGKGDDWKSWANSRKTGKYLAPDFRERTLASPGEDNTQSIVR